MEPHQLQTVSCHQLVQLKAFVPPLPRRLQNWWCCIVPVSWGKLLSSLYSGCLSPANVTTEVKCVEMHREALSEAIPKSCPSKCLFWQLLPVKGGEGDMSCDWKQPPSTAHDYPEPSKPNHCRLCPSTGLCKFAEGKTTQHSEQSWKAVLGSRKLVQLPSVRSPAILCVLRRFSNSAPKRWRG